MYGGLGFKGDALRVQRVCSRKGSVRRRSLSVVSRGLAGNECF